MGFGILFVGYALTFASAFFTQYLFLDIIGCLIMLLAFAYLWQYNRSFKFPAAATAVLTAVYIACAVLRLMGFGTPEMDEYKLLGERIFTAVQNYVLTAVTLAFYATLLYAIAKLATEVELPHIAKRCRVYTAIFPVYVFFFILFDLIGERVAAVSIPVYNVTAAALNLFIAVWLMMMMLLIMSCMKWIAPAETLEAEARGEESRNILTRIGVKLDKLQASVNVPREEKEARRLKDELSKAEKQSSKDSDKK